MNHKTFWMVRILAAPWQQQRNRGTMWSVWLIVFLIAFPVLFPALVALGLRAFGQSQVPDDLREAARMGAALGLTIAWVVQVDGVLRQNHPTLARLMPAHVRRLRGCLLTMWVVLVGVAGMFGALGHESPMAWMTAAGAASALVASGLRWHKVWILVSISLFYVSSDLRSPAVDQVALAVLDTPAIGAIVMAASAWLIVSLVQAGSRSHARSYERRSSLNARMAGRVAGAMPLDAPEAGAWTAPRLTAPYFWQLRRLTARRGSSAKARALLALGPGLHWTTRLASAVTMLGLIAAVDVGMALSPVTRLLPLLLFSAGLGGLLGSVLPLLGFGLQGMLHQTRGEQALLALLPGLPRGGAQSRWLSWQFTWQFLGAWCTGLASMTVCPSLALALSQRAAVAITGQWATVAALASLPLVVFVWRPWARLPAPTLLDGLLPWLAGLVLAAIELFGALSGRFTPLQAGAFFAALAAAWCALRWRRMATEPEALPAGRLAHVFQIV
jgi:hypothetical protein